MHPPGRRSPRPSRPLSSRRVRAQTCRGASRVRERNGNKSRAAERPESLAAQLTLSEADAPGVRRCPNGTGDERPNTRGERPLERPLGPRKCVASPSGRVRVGNANEERAPHACTNKPRASSSGSAAPRRTPYHAPPWSLPWSLLTGPTTGGGQRPPLEDETEAREPSFRRWYGGSIGFALGRGVRVRGRS